MASEELTRRVAALETELRALALLVHPLAAGPRDRARAATPPEPERERAHNPDIVAALKTGDLQTLALAAREKYPFDAGCAALAAEHGRLEALKWLRALPEPCPWDEMTCVRAAEQGHSRVISWALGQGCPVGERTAAAAAGNGSVAILEKLENHGCPLSEWACAQAASRGHLGALQWLHRAGCPWDATYCYLLACGDPDKGIPPWPRVATWIANLVPGVLLGTAEESSRGGD